MSSFLNLRQNKPIRRPPSSHLLGRTPAAGSSSVILNSRRSGVDASSATASSHFRPYTVITQRTSQTAGADGAKIVNDGGQVQLQRMAPVHRRGQQAEKRESLKEGQIDMEEVLQDIAILEQQQLESERMLQSVKLARQQKLDLKASQEAKLSKFKYINGAMRADLHRANKELSIRHRQLIEARGRCDNSRKEQNRFGAKLRRALGVARILQTYHKKIESAMIAYNESETRSNFIKGQMVNKVNATTLRRDGAKRRQELLVKAIQSHQQKERTIADDILKIRSEISGNELDLSSAQQMESQTKLQVETIEHEIGLENTRHFETISELISQSDETDVSKTVIFESIQEKNVMIEAKREELLKIWMKCNEMRSLEGHDAPLPVPRRVINHAQSLDVAHIRMRVDADEMELRALRSEKEKLSWDAAELERKIENDTLECSEMREEAEALLETTVEGRNAEELRKESVNRAVEDPAAECQVVSDLRQSIKDLTATQEKNTVDLKQIIPRWGIDHAQSLDVARIRMRVGAEEMELRALRSEKEKLSWDVAELERKIENDTLECSEMREEAEALLKTAAEGRNAEEIRKESFNRAVEEAAAECQVVSDLRQSIKDLTAAQETVDLKLIIKNKEEHLLSLCSDIENILSKLVFIDTRISKCTEEEDALQIHFANELVDAKMHKELIENAFSRAQKRAVDFPLQTDDELVAEMKKFDDEEEAIRNDAFRGRAGIISLDPFLENIQYDLMSSAPIVDQTKECMAKLRNHCLEFIEDAKVHRQIRVDQHKHAHFARLKEKEEARRQEEEKENQRIIQEEEREEQRTSVAAEAEQRRLEAKRRAQKEVEAETRKALRNSEKKIQREQALAKKRDEEDARMRKQEREKERRKHDEEKRASKISADLERKTRDEASAKRRDEDKKRAEAKSRADEDAAEERAREVAKRQKDRVLNVIRAKSRELQEELRVEDDLQHIERDNVHAERRSKRTIKEDKEHRLTKNVGLRDETVAASRDIDKKQGKTLHDLESDDDHWIGKAKTKNYGNKSRSDNEGKYEIPKTLQNSDSSTNLFRGSRSCSKRDPVKLSTQVLNREIKRSRGKNDDQPGKQSKIEEGSDVHEATNRESIATQRSLPSQSAILAKDSKRFRGTNDDQPRKQSKIDEGSDVHEATNRESIATRRSLPSQSAIRAKDSKRSKSISAVRFDQSVNRPTLDIFSSGVHTRLTDNTAKSSKNIKPPLSKSTTQTSGISSCEGGVRRRKKGVGTSKSKSSSLALSGFDDDAGFL